MGKVAGKLAIVTGAGKGIGSAIARALAAEGASVVVNYSSSRAAAAATVQAISDAGGKAIAAQGDVSKAEDAENLFKVAEVSFGPVNILVNNAAVGMFAPFEGTTEADYHHIFRNNVLGTFQMVQAALPSKRCCTRLHCHRFHKRVRRKRSGQVSFDGRAARQSAG